MDKLKKKKVLIFDFNILYDLLSGGSVITQIQNDDIYQYEVVFNRSCELEKLLKKIGIKTYRLNFHPSNKMIQVINMIYLLPKMLCIYLLSRPDLVHANNVMAARFGAIFSYIFKVPLLVHLRNVGFPPRSRWIVKNTNRFASTSIYTAKNSLEKSYMSLVDIVYDGFDFSQAIKKKLNKDQIRVGMCSRLSKQKGVDIFCDIARYFRNDKRFKFFHAGGIPSVDSKNNYIKSLALNYLDDVHWCGYKKDIDNFWSSIDIAILPAREDEAFGRVIAEAMAHGIPVISSYCGGPEEIIENNISGILIDHKNKHEIVNTIFKLIEDDSFYNKISSNASNTVRQNFSIHAYLERIHEAYSKTINWKS